MANHQARRLLMVQLQSIRQIIKTDFFQKLAIGECQAPEARHYNGFCTVSIRGQQKMVSLDVGYVPIENIDELTGFAFLVSPLSLFASLYNDNE
jgi:hypothetical protein